MRATYRSVALTRLSRKTGTLAQWSRYNLLMVLLVSLNIVSAFFLVYAKDVSRRAFIQYQSLQTEHQVQMNRWSKLLLEQSTWSAQSRVARIATEHLGMVTPNPKDVVIINETE
jgi:cell division protein FtsL